MARRPPPISLRIRSAEVTRRARAVLRHLDEGDERQRRVKWQALKAVICVREMRSQMSTTDRACYGAELERVLGFLQKIRGGT